MVSARRLRVFWIGIDSHQGALAHPLQVREWTWVVGLSQSNYPNRQYRKLKWNIYGFVDSHGTPLATATYLHRLWNRSSCLFKIYPSRTG